MFIDNFIQHLHQEEILTIRKYLESNTPKSELSSILILFDQLSTKNSLCTDNNETINSIKSKIFEYSLEALQQLSHIRNDDLFNDREQTVLKLKKQILSIKILYRTLNNGRVEAIEHLLNDVIKQAKENEVYDVLVEALTTLKYFKGIRVGNVEFEKINEEVIFYTFCLKARENANDSYYRLILNNFFIKSLSKQELLRHIQDSINQMKDDYKSTKSQEVNYYLHIMQIAYYEHQKEYDVSLSYCKELINILKKSKVIYSMDRIGFALVNSSHYSIFMEAFEQALKFVKSGQKLYKKNNFNFLMSLKQEFEVYFYSQDYQEAQICLDKILDYPMSDTGSFRKSKFIYYQACLFFAQSKNKGALQLLNNFLEIEKDKTRWNISLRILNIMCFIELNKLNEASASLEALRKFVERNKKNQEVKPRKILILKVLKELERNGFEYDGENSVIEKMLSELSDKNGNVAWEYYTSEMNPFHEWMYSIKKVGKLEYEVASQ